MLLVTGGISGGSYVYEDHEVQTHSGITMQLLLMLLFVSFFLMLSF